MHLKLYKAKLITVQDSLKSNMHSLENCQRDAIHNNCGMIKHIFQRNQHLIKELKLSRKRDTPSFKNKDF